MNRFLKVFGLIAFLAVFASCKNDDDVATAPPRDYGIQNTADMDSINKFLDTHYIVLDETTLEATFPEIPAGSSELSIRQQKVYPLDSLAVRRNSVDYKIYYLNFRQGVGDAPSGVDEITVNYRGTLLNGTQFDYSPVVGTELNLYSAIAGWQDILPLFNSGTYVAGNGGPSSYVDFGAGAMFIPSGLAYFNASNNNLIPAYSPLVFSFQLFDVEYGDIDGDKILNKDEFEWEKVTTDGVVTWKKIPVVFSDTDGDGIPNYADTDDDGDGRFTKDEIRKTDANGYPLPTEYWTYAEMFEADGITIKGDDPNTLEDETYRFRCENSNREYSNVPKYMDSTCKGGAIPQ